MELDGMLRNPQPPGDFLIWMAFRDEAEHFGLTRRKGRCRARARRGRIEMVRDKDAEAGSRRPNGDPDLLCRRIQRKHPISTRANQFESGIPGEQDCLLMLEGPQRAGRILVRSYLPKDDVGIELKSHL